MLEFINDIGKLFSAKRERERHQDDLRQREVEALEAIAKNTAPLSEQLKQETKE